MNELAVKAANGTNSEDDRNYIQDEIDQLVTEIDRVATTTKFNETYLLKGTNADGTEGKLTYATAKGALTGLTLDDSGEGKAEVTKGTNAETLTATIDGAKTGDETTYKKTDFAIDGVTYTLIHDVAAGKNDAGETLGTTAADVAKGLTATDTQKYFADLESLQAAVTSDDFKEISISANGTTKYDVNVKAFADLNSALNFRLHVGADSTADNKIDVNISMMSARGLGVNGLQVNGDDDTNATAAIDTITEAIQKVSTQRSALGAVQNRLEHTIANLDNVVENTTAAESQIRDTDMATEMVKYSNNNILAQAGQAMLAQANQANQGVLSLLG